MKAELKGYKSTRGIFHQSNTDKDIKFFVRHWKEGGVFDQLGQLGIGQQGLTEFVFRWNVGISTVYLFGDPFQQDVRPG